MLVGYARVSTTGQDLSVQREKLSHCEKVFEEKKSGLDGKRQELMKALEYVREGDTLVVTKLDRLARSTTDFYQIIQTLKNKGASFKTTDQDIDTSTREGRLLIGVLALIAEFETDIRRERQAEGIAKAKAQGVHLGRKASLTDNVVATIKGLRDDGKLIKEIMETTGLSKASVYRALSMAEMNPQRGT